MVDATCSYATRSQITGSHDCRYRKREFQLYVHWKNSRGLRFDSGILLGTCRFQAQQGTDPVSCRLLMSGQSHGISKEAGHACQWFRVWLELCRTQTDRLHHRR